MHLENSRRYAVRDILITLLLNALLPFFIYKLLKPVLPDITALLAATLVPLAENAVRYFKHRRFDAFGMLMLSTFVLGAALAVPGGGEKPVLMRESLVTAAVGCWFLVSLLFPKPFLFHLAGRFVGSSKAAAFEERWTYPYMRTVFRLMTAVWGLLLVAEAVVRVILVYRLSTEQFLMVSNFVFYGFIGAAVGWTVWYRRRASRTFIRLYGAAIGGEPNESA